MLRGSERQVSNQLCLFITQIHCSHPTPDHRRMHWSLGIHYKAAVKELELPNESRGSWEQPAYPYPLPHIKMNAGCGAQPCTIISLLMATGLLILQGRNNLGRKH